ncbi:hypothetical protein EYF80_011210 [Liparis tanakae]|uniref:Uncharacterized protein n=1 Tax=Liparis tanakae TaxID=230148 RepID=A0A4Z2ILA0_9TELE|nr:hypothetical protein EYF80_011210 [Liparis tanakae]
MLAVLRGSRHMSILISCLHCTKRGKKDDEPHPGGAQYAPPRVCGVSLCIFGCTSGRIVKTSPRTHSHPENAWKEDVCPGLM